MELRHLRYFVALAECLNFTRAAERVHVTQSTLSHQIRQLEEELGQPLFDRVGRKVVATEAGQQFLAFALRALKEVDAGIATVQPGAAAQGGQLRIGATHTFNIALIPDCLALFLDRHPTVRVAVEELAADVIDARLRSGELDLGIAYRPQGATDLRFEPLYDEEMVLVVGSTHALAARRRIRMIELHRQRLVLLPRQFSTRTMLEDCFAASGAQPEVVAEMSTVAPMLGLAQRTQVGAIVAATAVAALPPGLCRVPIESPTPVRTPGLLWNAGTPRTPAVQSFASIVRRLTLARRQARRRR